MTIIRPDTCSTCIHKFRLPGPQAQSKSFCRRFPPTAHPIHVVGPNGPQCVGVTTTFPEVQPESTCGEYRNSRVKSNGEVVRAGVELNS